MKRSFQIDMPKVETFDKTLVIKQATDVFHDKGYSATSMQDLVDATGLNRSSIYNSFDNKHNLFIECLTAYQSAFGSKLSEILLKSTTPLESIQFIFDLYLKEMTAKKKDKGCLIVNCTSEMANHDKPITLFLQKNQEKMLGVLEDLVEKGQNEGTINKNKHYKAYALYLFTTMQGFRITGMLVSDKEQLQSVISTITQTLI
ncbi:MAG: TetR/AcrR family transcriptional regulator [Algibacter sp.]